MDGGIPYLLPSLEGGAAHRVIGGKWQRPARLRRREAAVRGRRRLEREFVSGGNAAGVAGALHPGCRLAGPLREACMPTKGSEQIHNQPIHFQDFRI